MRIVFLFLLFVASAMTVDGRDPPLTSVDKGFQIEYVIEDGIMNQDVLLNAGVNANVNTDVIVCDVWAVTAPTIRLCTSVSTLTEYTYTNSTQDRNSNFCMKTSSPLLFRDVGVAGNLVAYVQLE